MRMLENPGAVIPPADVYAGPRPSPFNVFATSQCYIFQVDCVELARVLDQYSEEESEQVTTALEKEHKALCDSLKSRRTTVGPGGEGDGGTPSPDMRRTSTARAGGRGGKGHALESALDEGGDAALEEKLKRMEEEAVRVVGAVFEVKKQTHMLPLVLQVLEQRIGVQADEGDTPASQALPAPTADDATKKEGVKSQRRGSGLFGCAAALGLPARAARRPPPDAAA